jgi:enoyl-CoA hydratase
MMGEKNRVQYEEDGAIAWVTLNDPARHNALHPELLQQLAQAMDRARRSPRVRAVILTGAGERAFSAGADIRYLHTATPLAVRAYARLAVEIGHQIETLGKVVIAALNGDALGGGLELAEACMLRLVVDHARLGHPEVRLGAVAGFGGTTRLPRLIGRGRAAELLLTGRIIAAEEAERLGLVHTVVARDALRTAAVELAQRVLEHAPLAVALTWEALHRGLDLPLDEATRLGADYFGLVAASDDFREGTRAFLAKETPRFQGR